MACGLRPRARALRARRPAASITAGLEVLVQEVMAAITTSPWPSERSPVATGRMAGRAAAPATSAAAWRLARSPGGRPKPPASRCSSRVSKRAFRPERAMRSWGRLGPATDGSTSLRSTRTTCE